MTVISKAKSRFVGIALLFVLTLVSVQATAEDEPKVSIMLFETDIREAINEMSLQTGVTIIADQTVNGRVTADLQNVPLDKALKMILMSGGYSFRKIEDFYFVGLPDPRNSTFKELVETKVVVLNNRRNRDIFDQLPSFLSNYVKGNPAESSLTISAPPNEMRRIQELIREMDAPKRQVEVKVVATEVNSEAIEEFGASLFNYIAANDTSLNNDWTGSVLFDGDLLTIETDIYGQLLSSLRLLEKENKATIKADPRAIVVDGESAEVFLGEQRVLLVGGEDDANPRIERVETGVSLKVTPRIVNGDEVLLTIEPEVSHLISELQPQLVIRESSVSTTIRVANGQTAVLAGMTGSESASFSKKIPVLGDIPLIRWLFRNDKRTQVDRELLLFVTPVIR